MAEVWLAERDGDSGRFALKLPVDRFAGNPKVREYFRNEAAAQLNLRHPNIVPAYDLIDDGVLALVLQYVPGVSLEEKIYGPPDAQDLRASVGQALPVATAIRIAASV